MKMTSMFAAVLLAFRCASVLLRRLAIVIHMLHVQLALFEFRCQWAPLVRKMINLQQSK